MGKPGWQGGVGGRQQELTWDTRVHFALQCSRAVHFLHTRRPAFLHKDIKSGNFLIDFRGVIKLADFGVSEVTALYRLLDSIGFISVAEC